MATRALDIITILHALSVLDRELGTTGWNAKNPQQQLVFTWLEQNRQLLAKITGLDAKASRFWQDLNQFLTDHGFDPMVQPFDPDLGIGVVSILDKLVKWRNGPGALVSIETEEGARPGFELPASGVHIYEVSGYPGSYLLELLTKTDDTLWQFVHGDTSLEGLDMVALSMNVMSRPRQRQVYAGAQITMLDLDVKPDLRWLLGADTTTKTGQYYSIVQAAQEFKMRMDETGARVKVATLFVSLRLMIDEPKMFILDRPFYGWWTQRGMDNLPMAAFFADWDALHKPAGSLDDL